MWGRSSASQFGSTPARGRTFPPQQVLSRATVEPLESRALLSATFTSLGELDGGGAANPRDVSSTGVVVGTTTPTQPGQLISAFRWVPGSGIRPIGSLVARGVSEDGSVAVGVMQVRLDGMWGTLPFRWTREA